MNVVFLQSLFPEETLKALCWTLIHSLWQGALAAALAGMIILNTRKSAARVRYNLLCGVLFLFAITVTITFCRQAGTGDLVENTATIFADPGPENTTTIASNETMPAPAANFMDSATAYFNEHAGLFVLIWAALFLVHCIKMATGLAGVRRLRHAKTCSPGEDWQTKLDHLSRAIGLRQPIRLLQSGLVRVPVAIGLFKPVILVPLGLLAHLPPEQVETILLHELAHIRRRDYLVNLLQCLAEAIFFFNPALLWISSLVRQEREACCDDIVVANTTRKRNYLEALVSFQEYSLNSPAYAMAIGSKQHYLLNRVKRMLTRENKKLNLMEKSLLTLGLAAIMAFNFIPREEIIYTKKTETATFHKPVEPKQPALPAIAVAPVSKTVRPITVKKAVVAHVPVVAKVPAADTVPAPGKSFNYNEMSFPDISSSVNDDGTTRTETTTVTDRDGKKYTVTKLNNKVTTLTIDGRPVPENEINNYAPLLQKIDQTVDYNRQHRKEEMRIKQKERDKERKEKDKERMKKGKEMQIKMKEMNEQLKEKNKQIQEKNRQIREKNRQVIEQQRQKKVMQFKYEKNKQEIKIDTLKINLQSNINLNFRLKLAPRPPIAPPAPGKPA
jgi:bla regulator protein blaR1